MYAKPFGVGLLIITSIGIVSYGAISAYSYATTTTLEDVTEKALIFKKAESDLEKIIIKYCNDSATGKVDYDKCEKEIDNIGTHSTGSTVPPSQGYTSKHQLVLSGSHNYRIYSARKGAVWKNNNPSGLTWGVSNTLKSLWKERGIHFEKGTLRPKLEGGNYILFLTIEDGLRAKIVSIRERWGKATVWHFLAGWGTDYVKLSFSTDKIISELTEEEFAELFIQQLKKESPGLVSQLVKDGILLISE